MGNKGDCIAAIRSFRKCYIGFWCKVIQVKVLKRIKFFLKRNENYLHDYSLLSKMTVNIFQQQLVSIGSDCPDREQRKDNLKKNISDTFWGSSTILLFSE